MALFGLFASNDKALVPSWTFDAKSTLVAGATAVEFGKSRAIFLGTKDGRLLCLDDQGKERWSFTAGEKVGDTETWFVDASRAHAIDAPPVVADLDGDGKPEVLFGTEQGVVYCLAANGKLKWKHDCGALIQSSVCVGDMNADGHWEILVGCANNRVIALTAAGKRLFEYQVTAPVSSTPAVWHLPKQNKRIIVFGDDSGILHAITPAQEPVWRVHLKGKITAAPAFFHDTEEERLVIGTHAGDVTCVSEHGEIVWQYLTGGSVYATAAIADLNGDHEPEIVVGSCDNIVHAITRDGKREWTYGTDFWITHTPQVADLDGDGHPEVIVGSYDRCVYALDGPGEYLMEYVPGLSGIMNQAGHYGSVLTEDVGEQTGKLRWKAILSDMVVGVALLPLSQGLGVLVTAKNGSLTFFSLKGG